jgi:hypothetical protein
MYLNKKGQWRRGHHKGAVTRRGADTLRMQVKSGEIIYRQRANIPAIEGQFYVRDSVEEMREEFISEIEATIRGVIYG